MLTGLTHTHTLTPSLARTHSLSLSHTHTPELIVEDKRGTAAQSVSTGEPFTKQADTHTELVITGGFLIEPAEKREEGYGVWVRDRRYGSDWVNTLTHTQTHTHTPTTATRHLTTTCRRKFAHFCTTL